MNWLKPKSKIKILATFSIIAYLLLIASTFVREWEDMKIGIIQGSQDAQSENTSKNVPKNDVYFLTVAPKKSVLSFPESLLNLKTQNNVELRYHKMKVILSEGITLSNKDKLLKFICTLCALIVFAVFVFLPYQFIKLMRSLRKEEFFDIQNIKRFGYIGKALIILYLAMAISNDFYYEISKSLFEFENYKIIKDGNDIIWLLIGLVFLIVAKTISQGVEMKKEQELTI